MTFEEKMKKLAEIASRIEDNSCPLDESIAMYEEGLKLSKELKEQLGAYEKRIREIEEGSKDE